MTLFRSLFYWRGKRLRARPTMLGDVEQHPLRAIEFLFEIAGLVSALTLVDVVLGHLFGVFGGDGDVAQLGHGFPPRIADRVTVSRLVGSMPTPAPGSCRRE